MKIVVNRGIGMNKQGAFQTDLFDFTYIEDQIKEMKNSTEIETEDVEVTRDLNDILEEQLSVLHDIQYLLSEIGNHKQKKKWFSRK